MLLILGVYTLMGVLFVKHRNEVIAPKILKIFLLILYLLTLVLIAYLTLFIFMFGYNS
ncbi:hypothetical protein SGADD02_02184 [Streptococcus gallolyticus]|uniref:Uncharacterized protein n=1 Tax=Streptococcus gallolyticus TaxID=315405 RepID=A0A139QL10_9STRE|nr:hypothetical protein SGADD02_02184 [Streptococcus gallolyticus]KXU03226.1 hypothetical protein SGADD03_02159 [Streptococcus gallolyticus]